MFVCRGLEPLCIKTRNKYDFKRDPRQRQKRNAIISLSDLYQVVLTRLMAYGDSAKLNFFLRIKKLLC